MTRVKVTGITNPEDAEFAVAAGVDLLAVVFYASSPRYISSEQAWAIGDALPCSVPLVGVFVDTPTPLVQRVMDHCRLDAAQLFGSEQRSAAESLRPHAFKAVTVESEEEIEGVAKKFLGRKASNGELPSLMVHLSDGASTAWARFGSLSGRGRLALASDALTAATVGGAIRMGRPWAVDVWEAVETEPGHLDRERLREFIRAVREADAKLEDSGG
jgi:phosphoribosylanthranilate isomerase